MAQNLQSLKRRIKTAKNIAQIAKAMEMIAASKIKRAQNMVTNNKPYATAIIEHTKAIIAKTADHNITHPYLKTNSSDNKLLIMISPDKGLCGPLVTNLTRKFLDLDTKKTSIITIGKKMERVAARFSNELVASFPIGTGLPSFGAIYPIIKIIDEYYSQEKVGTVEVFYPEFTSVFTQTPQFAQILPISPSISENSSDNRESLFEPSSQSLLNDLLPYYLEVSLYSFLIESHTSEQAARMIAMQNAKNNAFDIADYLTLTYNKSRQEKITYELLDLANGAQPA